MVEVTRTYLEMQSAADLADEAPLPPGAAVLRVRDCPPHFFRYLYVEVGRHYHWRDRLTWSDREIRDYLAGPVSLWVLVVAGVPAGYYELRRHDDDSVEIAYFGLMPEFQGRGLGRGLLTHAVRTAWGESPSRVWLHTCTLDHPGALPNYLKRGFRRVRTEVYDADIGP